MVPIEKSNASIPDIKLHDPVPNPKASTTKEDIARAEGEGMLPAPRPRRSRRAKRPARIAP